MKTLFLDDSQKDFEVTLKKHEEKQFILFLSHSGEYNFNFNLAGDDSKAEIAGIVVGKNAAQIKLNTQQNHLSPNSLSNLLIKSVITDSANFSFQGLISMSRLAQKSNAYQRNENLLLSSEAKVNTKPYLEILANDVTCTHGATVGHVDEEQIFYLMSRGLSKKEAVSTLTLGFLKAIDDKIQDESVKKILVEKLDKLFNDELL